MNFFGIIFSKMEVTLHTLYACIHKFVVLFMLIADTRNRIGSDGALVFTVNSSKISNVQEDIALQWPMGIVTYYLDNHAYDHYIAHRVRMAMNTLEGRSCVRFKPTLIKPTGNITWIHLTNPERERNCVHEPIYKGNGEIIFVLGFDCLKQHEITHSLLHAIGFNDEVSHPHRDQYIRVLWNNIHPEYRHLYRIQSNDVTRYKMLVEYDPLSVMHFHDRAFSMNGQATVMPLVPGLVINPMSDLSQLDKMKLRLLFDHECNKRKIGNMIDTCKTILSNNTKSKDADDKGITPPVVEKEPNINDSNEIGNVKSDIEITEIGPESGDDRKGKGDKELDSITSSEDTDK